MHTRRDFLGRSAALGALFLAGGRASAAANAVIIQMLSTADGSGVWFDPVGLWVPPGTLVRWSNGADQANTHTSTAYAPSNGGHALRIPAAARPWDSGYVMPGQTFETTLTVEGVYDYYCTPHEQAGMVGRIVVGTPRSEALATYAQAAKQHPDWVSPSDAAMRTFPPVGEILSRKVIKHT